MTLLCDTNSMRCIFVECSTTVEDAFVRVVCLTVNVYHHKRTRRLISGQKVIQWRWSHLSWKMRRCPDFWRSLWLGLPVFPGCFLLRWKRISLPCKSTNIALIRLIFANFPVLWAVATSRPRLVTAKFGKNKF